MTEDAPDPLLRFADTPYRFHQHCDAFEMTIESNDLTVALAVRRFAVNGICGGRVTRWKLIVDRDAPAGREPRRVLRGGPVTLMLVGTGTLIVFDPDRAEILGFVAPDLSEADLDEILNELFANALVADESVRL